MIQKCNFDKVRDIQEHVPSLATDLNKAIETNTVRDTGVVADFNSIDEPNAITGRVSDAFEAIDAQRAILAAGKAAKSKASDTRPVIALGSSMELKSATTPVSCTVLVSIALLRSVAREGTCS